MLGNTFTGEIGFEAANALQTGSTLEGALVSAQYPNDGSNPTVPFAYLNYIILDENMAYVNSDEMRVGDEAGFYPNELGILNDHQHLTFGSPINITQNGYIYIWVSNQSEDTKVWFDGLTVKFSGVYVTQATDYGVWGDVIREAKTDENIYRFGYQGQYSEKDEETGWNHFKAREFNTTIGRWLVKDPASQYFSPYNGMSNNPINGVDPDGKWFWEPSYVRQARATARHTGGELILDKEYGLAFVDITNTRYNGLMGGHLLRFKEGQDRYDLMNELDVDFTELMKSRSTGFKYIRWMLQSGDDYATGYGIYQRNGQAPAPLKFIAELNPAVSLTNAAYILIGDKNIYGEVKDTNYDKVVATVDAVATLLPIAKSRVVLKGTGVPTEIVVEVVMGVHQIAENSDAFEGLRTD